MSQDVFQRLKPVCVPLLAASLLTPSSIPNVLKLLAHLLDVLRLTKASGFILSPSLISYVFFPVSNIVRRNPSKDIPDQVLERVLLILGILCEDWWWDCDLLVWEQIFMLAGAVVGGVEENIKGKGKARDEETKEAAVNVLVALLHLRHETSESRATKAQSRFDSLKSHCQTDKFIPILGQTIDAALKTVESPSLRLQRVSLEFLSLLIGEYAPDDLLPTILPGIVSTMTRLSLGTSGSKGWANGEIVAGSLEVMRLAIVRAIGDSVCLKEGTIHQVVNLEDLAHFQSDPGPPTPSPRPYITPRTPSWLQGTSSQLLIAMNSLAPLVSHPTPSALLALSIFSAKVLQATPLTLPRIQPLLLHFLLSLSNSDFDSISSESAKSLLLLLNEPSKARYPLLQALLRIASDNLSALPRLLPVQADAKVEHVAGLITAICRIAMQDSDSKKGTISLSLGIGKLLGPTGGIEKWGWNLLYVLEFVEPAAIILPTSSAQLMLENDPHLPQCIPFPELVFRNVSSSATRDALENMFRSLGRVAGDSCLFSIEWFTNVGRSGRGARSVTAMWCSCCLLEGVGQVSLSQGVLGDINSRSRRLTKLARSLAKNIAELWEDTQNIQGDDKTVNEPKEEPDPNLLVQHIRGISGIHETLHIIRPMRGKVKGDSQQVLLHQALSLRLLAVTAGVLQAQFAPLFLYALYPVLKSLVSPESYLSSTAFATLHFLSNVTSYASPANLLLSNFDYALDAVSRRLTRKWLDLDATKVLILLIRLVGSNIVDRAGDVVEECFDRLDEFHGYTILVEGLVEVLGEVVKVIKEETMEDSTSSPEDKQDARSLNDFVHWLAHRHDFAPTPHEAWESDKTENGTEGDLSAEPTTDTNNEPPPTPIQSLTKQIVSRSLYFLTHRSAVIRARILLLLSSSASVLPESAFLPSIHSAWPFILNRFSDPEFFVVSGAASLIEALVDQFGEFMFRRIWDDVWPRFRQLLENWESADKSNALVQRGYVAVGTESAYTHSHRIQRSLIKTMAAALKDVRPHDASVWQVLLAYRRFLHKEAHEELQECARKLYVTAGKKNPDAVWLVLASTMNDTYPDMAFLRTSKWDIKRNVIAVFEAIGI